ncbi:LysR family transcriptional regulator [Parapedomonas caeni]
MIELYLVRYFLAVVEAGGFTKAAATLHITQPTLSAGIAKLEAVLGVALFERAGRRVFLTDAGSRFLVRAHEILHLCNLAAREAAETERAPVVRLGLLLTIPGALAADLVARLVAAGAPPLELVEGTEQEIANRLKDGSLDYALTLDRGENPGGVLLLGPEEGYALALPRAHPLAGRPMLTATDLMTEAMIVRQRCEVLSETSRYFTDRNVRPRFSFRTVNDERALAMVGAGLGVTVMPESYRHPAVARLPLAGFNYRRRIALLRADGSTGGDGGAEALLVGACEATLAEPARQAP